MAEYLGKVELGGLYRSGTVVPFPSNPVYTPNDNPSYSGASRGNINDFNTSPNFDNWKIGDTPVNSSYKIKWVNIKDGNKTLYICDRVILGQVSVNELLRSGYASGKNIIIDGKTYKCRSLSSSEWNNYVINNLNIAGLPIPTTTDLTHTYNDLSYTTHSEFWHWFYMWTMLDSAFMLKGSRGADYTGSIVSGDYAKTDREIGFRPVLELVNSAPTISGNSNDALGDKNTPFAITYSVNDTDSANVLNVVEKLNGSQINSISNAPRNNIFTINITKEILDSLPLNTQNTIQISVTDGTATTYKTITFTRTNSGPSITNVNKDLGIVSNVAETYSAHDVEGNIFSIVEKVDNVGIKTFDGVDGTEYTTDIPKSIWFTLTNGVHTYTITATDSLGASTVRTFTFTKQETVIESTGLTTIISTDAAATKILLTPNWAGKENADIVFEVCNNAFDVAPTWENATSQTLLNKPYVFTNTVKTATNWGIDIRFKLTKKETATEGIEFYGLGGAFE